MIEVQGCVVVRVLLILKMDECDVVMKIEESGALLFSKLGPSHGMLWERSRVHKFTVHLFKLNAQDDLSY